MALARELAKRVLGLALVLFLVTLFTALLLSMVPGDPVDTLLPVADEGSPEVAIIHQGLAQALEKSGDLDAAARHVAEAERLAPSSRGTP